MTAGSEPTFQRVRKGYDVDQVDEFIRAQAAAWTKAVEAASARATASEKEATRIGRVAQSRIEELEAHLGHLTKESSRRVTRLQSQVAELHDVQSEIDQVHQQQAALTSAMRTATTARDEMLATAQESIAADQAAMQSEMRALERRTAAQAEQLVASAKAEADQIARATSTEIESQRRAAHKEATELKRQISQLTTQRDQLVRSLEAIATAGLQAHYGVEQAPQTLGDDDVLDLSDSVTIAGG